MQSAAAASPDSIIWGAACRPTLLFVATYMLTLTFHEATHAAVAYLLGFPSTLFHLWVNLDAATATPGQRALIAAAGPTFNLAVGVLSGLLYLAAKERPVGLLLLMFAIHGVYVFLGNMVGAALGGDVNLVLRLTGAPQGLRYGLSAVAILALATFMFVAGRELMRWAPRSCGRVQAVVFAVAAPWLLGAVLAVVLYWPLPSSLVGPTLVGTLFWVFAVMGSSRERHAGTVNRAVSLQVSDVALTVAGLVVVRALVGGVRLTP